MNLIFGYENVYFDTKSDYDLDSINERQYLKNLFFNLEQSLGSSFKDFEYYILFSHNSAVIPDSFNIDKKNKVLFWFSDETGKFPGHLTKYYTAIFKCYVKKEELNIFSNPLGYVNEFEENRDKTSSKKDVGVSFSGSLGKKRVELYKSLFLRKFKTLSAVKVFPGTFFKIIFKLFGISDLSRSGSIILFSKKFKSGLPYPIYYDYLLRSKFVLCPKGVESEETFRHIEALHTGSIVISEKMPDVSIYEGHPFIVYNNLNELNHILERVSRNEYDTDSLIKKHRLYYEDKLKVTAVAARIAAICKKVAAT